MGFMGFPIGFYLVVLLIVIAMCSLQSTLVVCCISVSVSTLAS